MGSKLALMLTLALSLMLMTTGCEDETGSSSGSSIGGTPANGGGLPAPTPTPTPVPDGTFEVKLNTATSLLSQTLRKAMEVDEFNDPTYVTDFNAECKIDPNATSVAERNIICYLEVEELDLYANGINLDISVSENDCEYVFEYHYYYFKREAGAGETTVRLFRDGGGNLDDCDTPVGSAGGEPSCAYDYSGTAGPNCCVGQYDVEVYSDSACTTLDAADAANQTNQEWGGQLSSCLAGPGTESAFKVEEGITEGFPAVTFTQTESQTGGVTLNFTPAAPVTGRLPNVALANFYSPALFAGGEPLELNGQETIAPEGIESTAAQAAAAAAGSTIIPARYYTWACADSGQEILGRIRLVVREWNTKNEISKGYIANYDQDPDNNPATPPPLQIEGEPDASGTDDFGSNVNDSFDWDDFFFDFGREFPNHD